MAVQKIEYENKTYLQNDPNIPEKNKVTEANMNEIKSKVNNNADELSTAQQNIEDLQAGQGTVSSDITSLKNRVTTLEGDNTKNKQDIANKVDKVEGKGLSTEDYTTAEKEKLAGLNNYDDTEIKKDIQDLESDVSDIKSEQETQNDLLERTQSALINITTPKSSNINVKDSSDLNAKVDVFGISEQETRSGKNKANSSAYNYDTISYQDLDVNLENNEFTISTDSLRIITEYVKVPIKFAENGTYTFGLELKANTSGATAQALIYDSTNKKTIGSLLQNDTTTYAKKTTTITIDDTVDKSNINVLLYCNGTVGNAYSYSYKNIFVNPGQDDEFEQYGASPSPEYPSEIENVTGDINIKIYNKNLLDLTKCGFSNCVKNEDGSVRSNINNNYYATISTSQLNNFILQNKGKSLTFSFEGISTKTINFFIPCKRTNSDSDYFETTKTGNSITMQIPEDLESLSYIQIRWNRQSTTFTDITTVINNIQLELNDVKTDFIEHKEQLITFPLAEGQKLADGDYLASDGIHHVRKQIELDGTENWGVIYENIFWMEFSDTKLFTSAIMTHFKYVKKSLTELLDNEFTTSAGQGHAFWIKKEGMALEEFKSFLSQQKQAGTPVIVEYELAEETVEAYTEAQQEAYNQLQNVLSYKTVTNVFTDKALLEFKYIADTQTWVLNKLNNINQELLNIAGGN